MVKKKCVILVMTERERESLIATFSVYGMYDVVQNN
jgi:hypothetical protein